MTYDDKNNPLPGTKVIPLVELFDPFQPVKIVPFDAALLDRWPWFREVIEAEAANLGCEVGPVFTSHLMAINAAMDKRTRLRVKRRAEYYVSPPIWAAIVGDTGSAKSSVASCAFGLISRKKKEDHARYLDELKFYNSLSKEEQQEAKKTEPKPVERTTRATTYKGAFDYMAGRGTGGHNQRDELSGWIKSFDAYTQGKGDERPNYLETWSGGAGQDRTRGGGYLYCEEIGLSIFGTLQTDLILEMKEIRSPDGFLPRFLLAFTGELDDEDLDETVDKARFDGLIDKLLEGSARAVGSGQVIELDDAAYKASRGFRKERNALNADVSFGSAFQHITNKMFEQIFKIAMTLHQLDVYDGLSPPGTLSGETLSIARFIFLRYFRENARWFCDRLAGETDQGRVLLALARWIVDQKKTSFTPGELPSKSRLFNDNPEMTKAAIDRLRMYSWLRPEGKKLIVNPRVHATFKDTDGRLRERQNAAYEAARAGKSLPTPNDKPVDWG